MGKWLTGLAVLLALSAATAAGAVEPTRELERALRDHGGYSVGFRQKFQTGTYAFTPRPSVNVTLTVSGIASRLEGLSQKQETLALIHHVGLDGVLRSWLFDRNGIVAKGGESYARLDFSGLRKALNVNSRAAVRAPLRLDAPASAPESPATAAADPAGALQRAADAVVPAAVREILAARRGRLLILPARESGIVPYAALPLFGDERLVDRWSVVVLPDLQVLLNSSRNFDSSVARTGRSLIVGDPDLRHDPEWRWPPLPGARREADKASLLFGTPPERVLIGAAATRQKVLSSIDGYGEADIIYFATHAIADSVNPMDGGFVALADGHLYGRDLRGKALQVWGARHPLVILSACQTALGKTFAGGSYGVARAFVSAGAGQVVGSLWNVDDAATAALMGEFAFELTRRRAAPEEALRRAQLAASRQFPDDPAAWASFTVFGAPSKD